LTDRKQPYILCWASAVIDWCGVSEKFLEWQAIYGHEGTYTFSPNEVPFITDRSQPNVHPL